MSSPSAGNGAGLTDVPLSGVPAASSPIEPVGYGELPDFLREALEARVRRLGYLGAFFGFAGRQPKALSGFHTMTEELKKALPNDIFEVVALAVATRLQSDYERPQHERLAAKQGQSAGWIAAAEHGDPSGQLTVQQAAVRALALTMLQDHGKHAGRELRRVVELLGQDIAVGILLLVGRYVAHAYVSNALELTNPVTPPP